MNLFEQFSLGLREALMDAVENRDMAALQGLEKELKLHAQGLHSQLASLLDEQQDYAAAGNVLRKVRFMDKLLEEIDVACEDIE
jgi:molecular chaperone HscB